MSAETDPLTWLFVENTADMFAMLREEQGDDAARHIRDAIVKRLRLKRGRPRNAALDDAAAEYAAATSYGEKKQVAQRLAGEGVKFEGVQRSLRRRSKAMGKN